MIINKPVAIEVVEASLQEATQRFEKLSAFSKEEITVLVQNLAESEPEIAIAIGALNEDMQLNEYMVKHVSAKGEITRTKDRETRARLAFQTTGLSKARRRQIARKAVKTKRANPSIQKKAGRKFKRAMKRRKQILGLHNSD